MRITLYKKLLILFAAVVALVVVTGCTACGTKDQGACPLPRVAQPACAPVAYVALAQPEYSTVVYRPELYSQIMPSQPITDAVMAKAMGAPAPAVAVRPAAQAKHVVEARRGGRSAARAARAQGAFTQPAAPAPQAVNAAVNTDPYTIPAQVAAARTAVVVQPVVPGTLRAPDSVGRLPVVSANRVVPAATPLTSQELVAYTAGDHYKVVVPETVGAPLPPMPGASKVPCAVPSGCDPEVVWSSGQ